jgi:hypothetical protein
MKRIIPLTCLVFLLAACTMPTQTQSPVEPTVAAAPTEAVIPSPVPVEVTPETMPPTQPVATAALLIQIISPLDGAVVNTAQVEIVGSAPAGAVISVNDTILIVGSDGQFQATVTLDEGPNVIEIIGSDAAGDQGYVLLSLFYEP